MCGSLPLPLIYGVVRMFTDYSIPITFNAHRSHKELHSIHYLINIRIKFEWGRVEVEHSLIYVTTTIAGY